MMMLLKKALIHQNYILKILIVFVLILLFMPPSQWNSNEEQYLGYAWRRFSPENLVQISALRDTANHRFLFEYLTGFSINHIGFEWTHALGHIIVALLYSISLVTFFSSLGLSAIAYCSILLTFVWLGEDILGREWLFRGFEPKTLAYPFVFFSFSSSLEKRFGRAYLLLAVATYFHFLVGGFWFLITFISQSYWTKNIKKTLLNSLKYLIACTPLFLMILVRQLQAQTSTNLAESANWNWIYSYFRAPHHVAPFASISQLAYWYKDGIVFLFGLTIISIVLYRYYEDNNEKYFLKLILALDFYLISILIISYFDKGGVLGKFILFRPSSVTLLLTLCLYALYLKKRVAKNAQQMSFVALVLISCLVIPNLAGHDFIGLRFTSAFLGKERVKSVVISQLDQGTKFPLVLPPEFLEHHNDSKLEEIIASSNNTDIFLIDPELEVKYLSFERKYNRPTLVASKFVPTTGTDIVRWYELINMRKELFNRGCPAKMMEEYSIQYLLAKNDRESVNSCGQELFSNQEVKLVKVN